MKMLVCADGSEVSRKAIKEAARIAANFKEIEVCILNVQREASLPLHTDEVEMRQLLKRFMLEYETKSNSILQEAVKIFGESGIRAEAVSKRGHTSSTILRFAAEEKVDLILLGSRGVSGPKKLLLGSVSNTVVQEAKCNVIIVKK